MRAHDRIASDGNRLQEADVFARRLCPDSPMLILR
jgi:hypothetical protein